MLRIQELIKRYHKVIALKHLSVAFQPGCINVLIGPSGCGKTSLFNCISGLEPFDHGEVYWEDQLLIDASGKRSGRMSEIGYVLQGFSLFAHLTVLENLTLAPRLVREESRKEALLRARVLLEKMQIADKLNAYPTQLSGGQQQRVAIARAIMMNPKVLLLDEPTNALDPQLIYALERTLKSLVADGLTLIISTHHLGFARRIADYTYFIHQGEIIETSTQAELLTQPKHPEIARFIQREEADVL